jgi:hypothetical protein
MLGQILTYYRITARVGEGEWVKRFARGTRRLIAIAR